MDSVLCNIGRTNEKNLLQDNECDLNMAVNSKSIEIDLRLWVLVHRVRHMISLCEDSVFAKYGITNEQFMVLGAIKTNGGSLRPTDIAAILERSQHGISMLVNRMVKAGLVKKTSNNRIDRRVVNVTLTDKGEKAIERAIPEQWNLTLKILSRLSEKDKHTVADVLETMKCECLGYLNPEMDMEEIVKNSATREPNLPRLYKRTLNGLIASGPENKRKRRKN